MITAKNENCPAQSTFFGLSTDAKPAKCANGSAFLELDTAKIYFFDAAGARWLAWGGDA